MKKLKNKKYSLIEWEDFRKTLNITPEEEAAIQLEKEIIEATINARDEVNMAQKELAKKLEKNKTIIEKIHDIDASASVYTLNHLLFQLGYRLKVVPLSEE